MNPILLGFSNTSFLAISRSICGPIELYCNMLLLLMSGGLFYITFPAHHPTAAAPTTAALPIITRDPGPTNYRNSPAFRTA